MPLQYLSFAIQELKNDAATRNFILSVSAHNGSEIAKIQLFSQDLVLRFS
jgi:hypothetical protein